ncbi:MAG: hypothetical protein NZ550_06515 [Fimbriimonadales bacterium]|nr:hypothetical protein [Fimbriimonadales bacterium]
MTSRKIWLAQAAQAGLAVACMPVPPPAERDWRSGASVALSETLWRIDEAGRRFAQRLLQAHAAFDAIPPSTSVQKNG